MPANISKMLQKISFCLALLLHLLLYLTLTTSWTSSQQRLTFKEKSAEYISSYVSQQAQVQPTPTPTPMIQKEIKPEPLLEKKVITAKNGYLKPAKVHPLDLSHPNQLNAMRLSKNNEEPVHMIGNKNNVPNPLMILFGKALTAHLVYPKIAVDFNLRGFVQVSFMLYPNGRITNLKLLKSSQVGILDESVIAAVSSISPLAHTDQYLNKPEPMVIGVIFE